MCLSADAFVVLMIVRLGVQYQLTGKVSTIYASERLLSTLLLDVKLDVKIPERYGIVIIPRGPYYTKDRRSEPRAAAFRALRKSCYVPLLNSNNPQGPYDV